MEEHTARVFAVVDRFVVDLGRELQTVFEAYPATYERWVTECLPFGLDKARRLRMIHKAVENLPPEILAKCPRPWQSLFALSRLPQPALIKAIKSGQIGPTSTVKETVSAVASIKSNLSGRETKQFSEADIIAGKLVGHPVESLSPDVRLLVASWLAGGLD